MRTIPFTKMHGLGNDFIVINAFETPVPLSSAEVRYLSDRHQGIGFDQLLIVEQPTHPKAQFKYRIFNADGGEVEQCGNGARCFARFVIDQGLTTDKTFTVETARGLITPQVEDDGQVTVNMGIPSFDPASLPFLPGASISAAASNAPASASDGLYTLPLDAALSTALPQHGATVSFGVVSMGNPHAVISVASVEQAPVAQIGPWLEVHPAFPQRVNAGFAERVDAHTLRLRVFERGAGETMACGTGACAAAAWGLKNGSLEGRVVVHMKGGTLYINWAGEGMPLYMTGPVATVFYGECFIPALT